MFLATSIFWGSGRIAYLVRATVRPLTPTLSPSAGQRERRCRGRRDRRFSLSPAAGGRVGGRGKLGGLSRCAPGRMGSGVRPSPVAARSASANAHKLANQRSLLRVAAAGDPPSSDFGAASCCAPAVSKCVPVALALIILTGLGPAVRAGEMEARKVAQAQFNETLSVHTHEPLDPQAAWKFARATFGLAEFATNKHERAEIAQQGIEACRAVRGAGTNGAALRYYLAMNLGQLARTRGMGGLKIVPEMEREFTLAQSLDEHFDYGGPDRNLGLLYRDAPSIGSIGSRSKSRAHLRRAVQLAPDYPENRLNLVETLWKWGDRRDARAELTALEEMWEGAKK